ncbi:probable serine hydrolase [Uranotaenia lowii]|uniref:probable serine hydrolase n=1 Tax=Uranotaenia lowii TaxID=190385 RepID=UPI00247A9806|nr:probable serine hydrolase [Uranotaenia lowii]XP_055613479.1 probable serine hydrolase [Uranotaenia lowii]
MNPTLPPKFEPVEIPTPHGHISGYRYGPKHIRPILLIHGYGDNSGSFERLMPLLPPDGAYLAIDLPGHGRSSRIPNGCIYYMTDTVLIILRIMKFYDWSKVSLICHSLGAMMSYSFIGMFPDKVDLLIGLDALQPSFPGDIMEQHGYFLLRVFSADEAYIRGDKPNEYSYEELIEKIHVNRSYVIPRELCSHILHRDIKESTGQGGKFYLQQDNRTKSVMFLGWSKEINKRTAEKISCPVLVIRAMDSMIFGDEEEAEELLEITKIRNPHSSFLRATGNHYMHLVDAERTASIITAFLDECGYFQKPLDSKL